MSISRAEQRDHARRSNVFTSIASRISWTSIGVLLCIFCIPMARELCAQNNDVIDMGGPVMQSPTVFLIFWLPSGFHYDPASTTAADIQYENLIARFFTDLSAGSYLTIASQYPGICSPPNIPTQQDCFGPVTLGGTFIDTRSYIHPGINGGVTVVDDSDIEEEVKMIMTSHNIVPTGLNQEFFVFIGGGVVNCLGAAVCDPGSLGNFFCAYHYSLYATNNQGNIVSVPYAFMPNVISTPGCSTVTGGTNVAAVDSETVEISHELLESITDPLGDSGPNWRFQDLAAEIGDLCSGDIGTVTANGHNYAVQAIWSNDDNACAFTFAPAIVGTKVEFTSSTGTGSLRSDASVSALLLNGNPPSPPFTLHPATKCFPAPCGSWDPSSVHVRVFPWRDQFPEPVLTAAFVNLTSGGLLAQWSLDSFDLKVRNPNGTILCEQQGSGSPPPLATISDEIPFAFATPNCSSSFRQLTLTEVTNPADDGGRFDVQVAGVTAGKNLGNQQSAVVTLRDGSYQISEVPTNGVDLGEYSVGFAGACDNTGNIIVPPGVAPPDLTCTITNTSQFGSCLLSCSNAEQSCEQQCNPTQGDCGSSIQECIYESKQCDQNCPPEQRAWVTVAVTVAPPGDTGKFDIWIDDVKWGQGIGDGGSVGPIAISASPDPTASHGPHVIDIAAPPVYAIQWSGGCGPSSTRPPTQTAIDYPPGDQETCAVKATHK
jgi:hypothetical protein